MTHTATTGLFQLAQAAYKRIRLLALLLISASITIALLCTLLALHLWPTYTHTFTPYLKWQDALLATLCYIGLILLGGSALVLRFLIALHAAHRSGMLSVCGDILVVRDLSPKNLASIYRIVGTALSCFLAALAGLVPAILIGWTLHLPHPALVILGTTVAFLLSLAGLVITFTASCFILIGCIGCLSFGRSLGAPHTYRLSSQNSLGIVGRELTISQPDQPESTIDLSLLSPHDQRHLLQLLRQRWLDAQPAWNPRLGDEIQAAFSFRPA